MKKAKVNALIKRERERGQQLASVARSEERAKYELLILPPDDGTGVCVIGGEPPKYGMVFVAIYPGLHTRLLVDPSDIRSIDMHMGMQRAAFRPIQMCQLFSTGQRVVWYNYQFEGLR